MSTRGEAGRQAGCEMTTQELRPKAKPEHMRWETNHWRSPARPATTQHPPTSPPHQKKLRKHTPCSASCQWCFTTNPKQQNRTNNAGMTWPSEEEETSKGQHVCAEPAHRQHKEERHTMWTGGHSLSAEHNQRTTGIQQTTRIAPQHTWMLETDTTNGHRPREGSWAWCHELGRRMAPAG